jgi:hypothetical protein
MKYTWTLFSIIIINYSVAQQVKILDSLTNNPIPFVAISFGSGNGFYANDKGVFDLKDVSENSFKIYSIGYDLKTMTKSSVKNNIIFLKPNNFELEEIHLTNKKNKYKTIKIKSKGHNRFLQASPLMIGEEIAVLISNNYTGNYDIDIKKIIVPIVTKTILDSKELVGKSQLVKKIPFSSLYRISFYENDNGVPGNKINTIDTFVNLTEKSVNVKIDLSPNLIGLPVEGIFIGLLNLGKTDEYGNLINQAAYETRKTKDGFIKIVASTKPYFPINYNENKHFTFRRHTFEENALWQVFYKNGVVKKNEFHNIGLGYELLIYGN